MYALIVHQFFGTGSFFVHVPPIVAGNLLDGLAAPETVCHRKALGAERLIKCTGQESFYMYKRFVESLGAEMWLREGDRAVCDQIAQHGTYEPDVLAVIERELLLLLPRSEEVRTGITAVDAGAHVGFFTLQMAKLLGRSGRVYAFEPDPENFSILKENVKDTANIVAEAAALTDGPGEATLSLNQGENKGDNRLWHVDNWLQAKVPTTSLDAYFAGAGVDFVKADIQGCEYAMLKGARATVAKAERLVMVAEYDKELTKSGFGIGPREFMAVCGELALSVELLDGTPIATSESLEDVEASWFNLVLRKTRRAPPET